MFSQPELQLIADFLNASLASGVVRSYDLAVKVTAIGQLLDREIKTNQAIEQAGKGRSLGPAPAIANQA